MNWTLRINEASNGALLFALLVGITYLGGYLARNAWADGAIVRNYVNKAALGMLTLFFGFGIKSAAGWWALHHLHVTGERIGSFPLSVAFGIGTFIAMWGVFCTLNALAPYEWLWLSRWYFAFGCVLFLGLLAF